MARRKREAAKFTKKMKLKLIVISAVVLLLLIGLCVRIIYIQVEKGEEYQKKVLSQQGYESRAIPYQRGNILDAKGTILATSVDVYNVVLDCKLIHEDETYIEPTITAILQCFSDVTEEELRTALQEKPDSRYLVLRKKLPYDQIQPFEQLLAATDKKGNLVNPKVQGVWFEKEYVRQYPYHSLANKVIGFTASGNQGIGGVEDYYNETLNGIDGREYGYLNSDNDFEKTIKEAEDGKSLVTTIDMNIQSTIERKIAEFNQLHANEATPGAGSKSTAVLIMNPQNGEVLAMADSSSYNLNNPRDLTAYYTQEQIDGMDENTKLDALNRIWENFCTTATFEPGSTAKAFTVAAGLDTGKLRGDETYLCDGAELVGGHTIHCVLRTGHGQETIEQAIMNSCNDALMQIVDAIGKEEFYKYQNIFNFGLKSNIDLPGEARTDSLIYTLENTDSASLATNSFGQNYKVTMIQLASAFSSVINGGNYYQPHLGKKILDSQGNTVQTVEPMLMKQTISRQTSDIVKGYLYSTVSTGTAKSAKVEGYSMGGKTGTAQKLPRENKKYLVSYIGFAPVDNPQVVVYVVIDEANVVNQAQSSLATKLAKEIMTEILPYMNIFKDEGEEAQQPVEPVLPTQETPEQNAAAQEDYTGNIFE